MTETNTRFVSLIKPTFISDDWVFDSGSGSSSGQQASDSNDVDGAGRAFNLAVIGLFTLTSVTPPDLGILTKTDFS